jgi:hypothetical protein
MKVSVSEAASRDRPGNEIFRANMPGSSKYRTVADEASFITGHILNVDGGHTLN